MFKLFYNDEKELTEIENYSNSDFTNFCVSETDKQLKKLRENELNLSKFEFEDFLKKTLINIKNTIYISENSNNQNIKTLYKALKIFRDNIDLHFRANYSEIINWRKETFLSQNLNTLPISETNKILTESIWAKKQETLGTEEFFQKERMNEIFKDYKSSKVFFDFVSLFKKKEKIALNFADASFLYRKLYQKKYIIESVTENDFRIQIYRKIDLDFEFKLKGLDKCTTQHKEIIFELLDKRNRI